MDSPERDRRIVGNMWLVEVAYRSLARPGRDRFRDAKDDMVGAGNLALVEAATEKEHLTPDDFTSYAYVCIRHAMIDEARLVLNLNRDFTEREFRSLEQDCVEPWAGLEGESLDHTARSYGEAIPDLSLVNADGILWRIDAERALETIRRSAR